MTIKKRKGCSKKTGRCRLRAVGDLTIATVVQNHAELMQYYSDYRHFQIDLSPIEEIDCSGIQLLLALELSTRNDGKQLILESPAAVVTDAMERLHIRDHFNWDADA